MKIYVTEIDENIAYPYEKFLPLLSCEKGDRIRNYHFRMDLLRSFFGDMLLRYGLQELGVEEKELTFCYGEYQKPYLQEIPYFYNISHSGKFCVCSISEQEIGVDIQEKIQMDREKICSLAKSFFAEEEYQQLISAEDLEDYFFALWTLKESYLKCKGYGLYRSLKSIVFQLRAEQVLYRTAEEREEVFFKTMVYRMKYRLSLCSKEMMENLHIIEISSKELLNCVEHSYS